MPHESKRRAEAEAVAGAEPNRIDGQLMADNSVAN
jgi:hypothetical protein